MTDDEASYWIAAYSPAHLDMDSRIRIELTPWVQDLVDVSSPLTDVVTVSPEVDGTPFFTDGTRYIDVVPQTGMTPGKHYECRVNMSKLMGVDSLADFVFDFVVDPRSMRFDDVNICVDPSDANKMLVTGSLVYSADVKSNVFKGRSLLECTGCDASMKIEHLAKDKRLNFTISDIKRTSRTQTLKLRTRSVAGFEPASMEISVPAASDFRLLSAKQIDAAEPYINLEFSSPLSTIQELDGLISIDRFPDIKIERNYANVKMFYKRNSVKEMNLTVSGLIKSSFGKTLGSDYQYTFTLPLIPPAVEIPVTGHILPAGGNMILPFRAVNLAAVDIEVVKVFPSNVLSFLHDSDMDSDGLLRRFGRLIYHRTMRLDTDKSLDLSQWQNFSVDLSGLFRKEPGAVYNIRLTYRQAYSLYDREAPEPFEEVKGITDYDEKTWNRFSDYIYREAPDYVEKGYEAYRWREADDPSKPSYYMNESRMPDCNVLASDLGLIVKHGSDSKYQVAVTDILTASPKSGVKVTAYNYQLQPVATVITDAQGFATIDTSVPPYIVAAGDGKGTTYLKVADYYTLSTSNFDVSGKIVTDGIKGFVYGDRGVWRPGDEVHLTLILEDKNGRLPADYPVVMELFNPGDQLYCRKTLNAGVDGFYTFHIPTEESVPTGAWRAEFKVGNQKFTHPVRIETIKPNRLKINISSPKIIRAGISQPVGLAARWLTGPVASGMEARMEMTLYPDRSPFKKLSKYVFTNPLISYSGETFSVMSGNLDSLGVLKSACRVPADLNSPGMLKANLLAKVAEPGGNQSLTSVTVPVSPFDVYVGIDLSKKEYLTDTDIRLPLMVVNAEGLPVKSRDLSYKIYRLDWDWWWEGSSYDLSRYVNSTSAEVVASGNLTATNGVAHLPVRVNSENWGKYLVLVRDVKGGHATGGTILVDWADWRGRSARNAAPASTVLSFAMDKSNYSVGDVANVYLPKCEGGKVLLSIENSSRVIRRIWVETSADVETLYHLPVDESMAPNFYVSATLLRPHRATADGAPIRLFGVAGALVYDPASVLHPEIIMPDNLGPNKSYTVKVKERDNRPMTYTLAIVDEGLLDITSFKTPSPWEAMNQREALGVDTWDMYDDIIGAFSGTFRSVHSIGGDDALRRSAGKEKRFNPVVKFFGPFTLKSGTASHTIDIPSYIGSVRVMVVAGHKGSYGKVDKTVPVTSDLMTLTSLPASLSCGDVVDMPVNLFAAAADVKNVTVKVETSGPLAVEGSKTRSVAFGAPGERLVNYSLRCSAEGRGRVIVNAFSGSRSYSDTVYIEVKNPMPQVIDTQSMLLDPGKSASFSWPVADVTGVSLQMASMPSLDFGSALSFMEQYQHLCTEQLSSKALFMLYGSRFLNGADKQRCDSLLPSLLKAILSRQTTDGGFTYWQGDASVDPWATSMAGCALTEAVRQGYSVDSKAIDRWLSYQDLAARNYTYSSSTDLTQAYRLYSMAQVEKPLKSAMNRLRESTHLSPAAAYALAAAYAVNGRVDVARSLISRAEGGAASKAVDKYYSLTRDNAIALYAYALCGDADHAMPLAQDLSKECMANRYVTQDVAFATVALAQLSQLMKSGVPSVSVTERGHTPLLLSGFGALTTLSLSPSAGDVKVENKGKSSLYLSLSTQRRLSLSEASRPVNTSLQMAVNYIDNNGKPLDVSRLKQNTEFFVQVKLSNKSTRIDEAALTFSLPSGWEPVNERLFGAGYADVSHCDVRDDKVCCYFAVDGGKNKTVTLRMRAAIAGEYILPPVICENMYNPACRAMSAAKRVVVER